MINFVIYIWRGWLMHDTLKFMCFSRNICKNKNQNVNFVKSGCEKIKTISIVPGRKTKY